MRKLVLMAVLLAFVIFPAACSAAGAKAAGGSNVPIPKELNIPQGVIKIGDPVDTVIAKLGQPVRIANNENYCWRSRIDLYGPELVVRTLPDKKIHGFYVRKWERGKTPEGIGVGSTKEAVKAVYGEGREYRRKDILLSYGGSAPGEAYLRFGISQKTNKVLYFWLGVNQKR